MKNVFYYEIEKRAEDFRIKILEEGICDSFFPTAFSDSGKGVLKCYADISGYGPVNSYVEIPCRTAVNVLISLIKAATRAMNYYMLPWNYEISTKSVYVDRRGECVKIIYIPVDKPGRIACISSIMNRFCEELIAQISEVDKDAFQEIKNVFSENARRAEDCLRELYDLREKVNASLDLCR